jgi:hypothetical protein
MWPAAYSSVGRTSMTVAVPALTRSSSCSRVRWSVSSGPEVGGAGLVGGGPVGAGDLLQQRVQGGDVVADETVVDAHAVAAGGDESGLPEGLQVGGGGGQAESGGLGEGVDAALALGEQVEQFQAFAVGQRLAGLGDGVEQLCFAGGVSHGILHKSMEYCMSSRVEMPADPLARWRTSWTSPTRT